MARLNRKARREAKKQAANPPPNTPTESENHPQIPVVEHPPVLVEQPKPSGLRFSRNEVFALVIGTIFALGGFVDVAWIRLLALFGAWLVFIYICIRHEGQKIRRILSGVGITLVFALVATGVVLQSFRQILSMVNGIGNQPQYPASTNKLTRVDGDTPIASDSLCARTMTDDARRDCLCPNPLFYTVGALPTPPDNNYGSLLTISSYGNPIYKFRTFYRDVFSKSEVVYPTEEMTGKLRFATAQGLMRYDPYSVVVQSTKAQEMFKLKISSSTGLRVICVNRVN